MLRNNPQTILNPGLRLEMNYFLESVIGSQYDIEIHIKYNLILALPVNTITQIQLLRF